MSGSIDSTGNSGITDSGEPELIMLSLLKKSGHEKEKAEQLLPMLEAEIANCWKFVVEFFAPVSK